MRVPARVRRLPGPGRAHVRRPSGRGAAMRPYPAAPTQGDQGRDPAMKRTAPDRGPAASPSTSVNDRFLRACRRQPVDKLPVWMMRQAGRYLPEYREVRAKHPFLEMCRTPELAARVTLQPVERLGVDAAILFCDILIPVAAMGVPLKFEEGKGPMLGAGVRDSAGVKALRLPDPGKDLKFVMDAIRLLRAEFSKMGSKGVPLIGFAGLPLTLACYIIEGGKSSDFSRLKAMMKDDPTTFESLLDLLARMTSDYSRAQVEAGAQAFQFFDTWAGILTASEYERFVLPHTLKAMEGVPRSQAPVIHFAGDCRRILPFLKRMPVDVLSIDWRVPLDEAARTVGPDFALQGNLDPGALLQPIPEMEAAAAEVVAKGRAAKSHIFNLGHGITPEVKPETALALVEFVHGQKAAP
ncbi:MAG: uroporphyrinogen decarboxylase [Elusimicrobia bacterium]|nr:uroporphyrinogen decarboxylase [Elusimicrobiota bacterium]